MDTAKRQSLLESCLARAADQLGDITPHVMARYYRQFPEALEHFEYHGLGNREGLEGDMVEQSLYCLLDYFQMRGAVEIVLLGTIPHHMQTLKVPLELFSGLMDCLFDVIAETIPPGEADERSALDDLHASLKSLIAVGSADAAASAAYWTGSSKLASP